MDSPEDAAERANRWLDEARRRAASIEPDWWLRLECGQVELMPTGSPRARRFRVEPGGSGRIDEQGGTVLAATTNVRVVIADDSSSFRTAFSELLASLGFTVVGEASSGEAAVRTVLEVQPDVAFLDARMAGMGGAEAARRIHARAPGIKLVLVSASRREVPDGALEKGAAAVLEKQELLEPGRILQTINAVLKQGAGT